MFYWYLSAAIYTIVVFSVGFSLGNIRSKNKKIEEELRMTEQLLKSQGDNHDTIKATLDLVRAKKFNELHSDKREYLAIWLPTILVIINIIVTVLLKNGK